MTLRAKFGLLFLGALQVTFLTAVGTFWAVQSWQLLTDDFTLVHEQMRRLDRALDATSGGASGTSRIAELLAHAATLEETELIDAATAAVAAGARQAPAVAALESFYEGEVARGRDRARFVAQLSSGLSVAVVALVLTGMLGYFAGIRVWLLRPLETLNHATEVISTGDLDHRVPITSRDEIGTLAESINAMAQSLGDIQQRLLTAEHFAAVGEMAAYVAHNIRNPLASVRATAQAEMDGLVPDDERCRALGDIVGATDRLGAWLTNMLRFSSPVILDRQPADVDALVRRCVDLVRPQLAASALDVHLALAEDLPAVSADVDKLEQVLSVLIGNAVEASPAAGTIQISAECEATAAGDQVHISVADDGEGVPPEQLARMFVPFSTTKRSGTGLGLAMAYRIVDAHQGHITVRNREGGGALAEIRLPAQRAVGAACRPS